MRAKKKHARDPLILLLILAAAAGAAANEIWIVDSAEVLSEPAELGDVIVLDGGLLLIDSVPEPGVRFQGNLWVLGGGEARLLDSVISFESTYHGQYSAAVIGDGAIEVRDCDYRVTEGIQHALVSGGEATLTISGTSFGDVQLIAAERSLLRAAECTGRFEVILQNEARIELSDIPGEGNEGELWLWPEVPAGAEVVYSPPMPGHVESWSYPPPGSTGVAQSARLERCQVLLWPLLVRQGSRLTLRDVPEANWLIVGLYLPSNATVEGLVNGTAAASERIALSDRVLVLDNASVDTWNLYSQLSARVTVRDCALGEILAMDRSRVVIERSTVDGSGGYLGARDQATIIAYDSVATCTIEASGSSLLELHRCRALPYPLDETGLFTRFGVYDEARLLADATEIRSTPVVGGAGLLGVTYISRPSRPPAPGESTPIAGVAALFSLPGGPAPGSWRLDALPRWSHTPVPIDQGEGNVEEGILGTWTLSDPLRDHELRLTLRDLWGRQLVGRISVRGTSDPPGYLPPARERDRGRGIAKTGHIGTGGAAFLLMSGSPAAASSVTEAMVPRGSRFP